MADTTNTEYKSTNPIIQKCLDILKPDNTFKINRVSDLNSFMVYCNKQRAFTISKTATFDTPDCVMYDVDIDNIHFDTKHFYKGLDFSDLKILYELCKSEYDKCEKQRQQHVLNYLDNCNKSDSESKNIVQKTDNSKEKRKTFIIDSDIQHFQLAQRTMRHMRQAMQKMLNSYQQNGKAKGE